MSSSRRFLWLFAVLAGMVALLWFFWLAPDSKGPELVTAPVERGDIEDSVTALGTLEPLNYVDVGTQVSGQLEKLHVEEGEQVEEGQLLAEIDATIYLAKVEATEAQLENLQAQLADREATQVLARLQAERQRNLIKLDATSQESVEQADATLRSATAQIAALKAQIRQLESQLKEARADLSYTRIYAPMTGTVVDQLANQGQTLNANQTAPIIVQIADLSTMTVRTQVSEADITQLQVGMPVWFTTLGQPDVRREGVLRQILPTPEIVNNVVLFNALFDVPNPDGKLLPQMSAQVFFVKAAADNVLTIPVSALKPVERRPGAGADQRYRVQVLENGEPQPRVISVGTMTRVSAEVLEGLEEGDEIVIAGGSSAPPAERSQRRPRF
ncbi:efflux RND transporter periplasmic adaptor subunit [Halopseudomonas bauzanensis]|uniref:Efflux RND transporter periplasmic adaptor subunit n=1 Tax=Halopseudomonas bauzanensis TaxID=653930 RepID=A0A031MGY4_9GAMM|nr:efflux RND transporter periplasmic adaptor subunit [Halopseudomonas bauzanensis]EZQ19260.1 ABC transporter substrate-binding protein [Halopseudomonas bauzanensis]TKA90820.1 efflux RND transporter periplasmic adaptor subunit [Halopseudomonas bauzanensis]SER59373.1 membrane fusion protein, macrolide-specific efflux system [Halopseudomonas bauzanensis]SFL66505.1 membrane fusion protein, macrolide-specific efflux system [Halopseudomonas bauzanensis]